MRETKCTVSKQNQTKNVKVCGFVNDLKGANQRSPGPVHEQNSNARLRWFKSLMQDRLTASWFHWNTCEGKLTTNNYVGRKESSFESMIFDLVYFDTWSVFTFLSAKFYKNTILLWDAINVSFFCQWSTPLSRFLVDVPLIRVSTHAQCFLGLGGCQLHPGLLFLGPRSNYFIF